jgi:hypothetical protein
VIILDNKKTFIDVFLCTMRVIDKINKKHFFFSFLSTAKDENVRRMMKEIKQLSDDSGKLQQILDLAASLWSPHQTLEESIRDFHSNVQRQLVERQANDSQLNVLELNLNAP